MSTQLSQSVDKVIAHLENIENQDIQRLDFTFKGINMQAFLNKEDRGTLITLKGTLGKVYYTVENADKRREALTQYYRRQRQKGASSYSLVNKHEIHFKNKTMAKNLDDQKSVIEALTFILMDCNAELSDFTSLLKPIH